MMALLILCLIPFKKLASAQRVTLSLRMTQSKSQLCQLKVIQRTMKFHVLKDTLFWICIKMVTFNDPFLDDGLNFTLLIHLVMEACFRKVILNILEKYEAFWWAPSLMFQSKIRDKLVGLKLWWEKWVLLLMLMRKKKKGCCCCCCSLRDKV